MAMMTMTQDEKFMIASRLFGICAKYFAAVFFVFYHTWYDFPYVHVLSLWYSIVIFTLLAFSHLW